MMLARCPLTVQRSAHHENEFMAQEKEIIAFTTPDEGSNHEGKISGSSAGTAWCVIQEAILICSVSSASITVLKSWAVALRLAINVSSRRWKSGSLKVTSPWNKPAK